MEIVSILLIALLIEAVVKAVKPLWNEGAERVSVSEIVAMALGVALAVVLRINLLDYVIWIDVPDPAQYIFYVLTGIALGRGPSFLHDLWNSFKELKGLAGLEQDLELIEDKEGSEDAQEVN